MVNAEKIKISLYGALGAVVVVAPLIFWIAITSFKAESAYAQSIAQNDVNTKILIALTEIKTVLGLKEKE